MPLAPKPFALVFSLLAIIGSSFAATVPVSEDASTTPSEKVTTSTGKAPTLLVDSGRDALLKFNLGTLPPGYSSSTLQSARIRIFVAKVKKGGNITVHAVTQDWSEKVSGDAPTIGAIPIATITAADISSKSFIVVDVTNLAAAWLDNSATNFGIALVAEDADPTAKIVLAAKEGPGIGPAAELEAEAAIPPGSGNVVGTSNSVVLGGENNTISLNAEFAMILGGQSNGIGDNGDFSLAAGRRAKVNHTGSFVWADSTNSDFSSTADNQFRIRAANGLSLANDGGSFNVYPVGTYFRDNSIVAWGRVNLTGGLEQDYNVASIVKVAVGVYRVNLSQSLQSGFSMIPQVTPEIDSTVPEPADPIPPVGAANARFAVVDKVAAGDHFYVYMYNGSSALVDNDFEFIVTGR